MANEADAGHDENVTSIHQAASAEPKATADTDNIALGLVMDIPVNVSLELGRTRLTIRELLELEPGALIPLDSSAAEEIEVVVNGKLVAYAEAVTIGERCGVRLTRIVSGSTAASLLQATG